MNTKPTHSVTFCLQNQLIQMPNFIIFLESLPLVPLLKTSGHGLCLLLELVQRLILLPLRVVRVQNIFSLLHLLVFLISLLLVLIFQLLFGVLFCIRFP